MKAICIALLMFKFFYESLGQSMTDPAAFTGGDTFSPLTEEVSNSGSLSINLDVRMADIVIEWLTIHRRTWNGNIGGPVWRVKQGDTVTVTLSNSLTLPQKEQAINQQRYPNSTNLHTHGLHISSASPQDNVFEHINPGESFTYIYSINVNNPPGTYWYHPHLHGSTLFQVHSGMAGMIIVEDPATSVTPAHIQAVSCPDHCEHEVSLVFQPLLQYSGGGPTAFATIQDDIEDDANFRHAKYTITTGGTLETWLVANVNHYTTNGQLWPTLAIPTGQSKRFRMVNAGGGAVLALQITDTSQNAVADSVCEVKQISLDGIYFDTAITPRLGKTMLVPSAKCDWIVKCKQAGTYQLRSVSIASERDSTGQINSYVGHLLTLTVSGNPSTDTIPTDLPARPDFVGDLRDYTDAQVTGRFVIEAGPGTNLNRKKFSSQTDYRFQLEVGTIQELFFVNSDPSAGHPIHMHINHFQVIGYNPYTGPYAATRGPNNYVFYGQNHTRCFYQHEAYSANQNANVDQANVLQYLGHETRAAQGGAGSLGYYAEGTWLDVILVPPLANITTRFSAHEFTGEVVIHCHLLNHEDAGMMMTINIVPVGTDLSGNYQAGTPYPGTCWQCDPYPFNGASQCDETATSTTTTTSSSNSSTTGTTSTVLITTTQSTSGVPIKRLNPFYFGLLVVSWRKLFF